MQFYDMQLAQIASHDLQLAIYSKHLDACGGFAASVQFYRYLITLGLQWLQLDSSTRGVLYL